MSKVRIYAVTMPNGDIYGVRAEIIAENYAKYYESLGEDYKENYDAMIEGFDTNDYEFADWAKNNMDWNDVKRHAVLLGRTQTKINYQEGWVNGKYEYRSKES